MRLIHSVPHVGENATGVSYGVVGLCNALGRLGHEIKLMTLLCDKVPLGAGVEHEAFPQSGMVRRLGRSKPLRLALTIEAERADILHSHSLWMMPNVDCGRAAISNGKPLVISPHGTLSPVALRRSAWVKTGFWHLLQGRVVKQAAILHATSETEYGDIRRFGLKQPVAIIPHGIELPEPLPSSASPENGYRTLLYVGRIHPIKGLVRLLRAWGRVSSDHQGWRLRLVGPDEGRHLRELHRLSRQLGLERFEFAGPKFGAEKRAEYASAELFVLPSFSENFGIAIAEALAHGVPVIATRAAPWPGLNSTGSGWWVDDDETSIEDALRSAMANTTADLAEMGQRGRQWMGRSFSWSSVANQMESVYGWLLAGGTPPDCVRVN